MQRGNTNTPDMTKIGLNFFHNGFAQEARQKYLQQAQGIIFKCVVVCVRSLFIATNVYPNANLHYTNMRTL